ncbi:MAG: hypothetical protein FGM27_01945 [Candidatus Omnitrophica bacterium]|nr:hypothetical protein [Candidatus Omnitrophota bacterium]
MKKVFWGSRPCRKFLAASALALFAQSGCLWAFDPGMPPLEESFAYQQFSKRVYNDLSVLIYLIDRFKEARIKINYDGNYFEASLAANVAKWFLKLRYSGETPEQWIRRWCDTGVVSGKTIWVQDAYGEFKMSREVLSDELRFLKAARARMQTPAASVKAGTGV